MTASSPGDSPESPRLKPGQPWGTEEAGPADFEVSGSDAMLSSVLGRGLTDPLVRFNPSPGSDLARAVGLVAGAAPTGLALPVDLLDAVTGEGSDRIVAVNSIVIGVAPDRLRPWHRPAGLSVELNGLALDAEVATTLVVMNGQYLRGFDLSPRGHPGDGVAEAQLYAVPPGTRRAMRSRLATGAHVPHPGITIRRARRVTVRAARPILLEVDGRARGRVTDLELTLRPAAYRLLV